MHTVADRVLFPSLIFLVLPSELQHSVISLALDVLQLYPRHQVACATIRECLPCSDVGLDGQSEAYASAEHYWPQTTPLRYFLPIPSGTGGASYPNLVLLRV